MNENDLRRLLRQWDPAADDEPPTAELYAGLRARMTRAADSTPSAPSGGWLASRWSLAAITVAGALLVAVTLFRLERPADRVPDPPTATVKAIDPAGNPVQVVYTASNGVRVYWSVPAAGSRL